MNKLLKKIKKIDWLLLTFLISTVVIVSIYTLKKIAPFGNNSMLDVDFYHQYGPLLNELYDRVKSGESLLYSFNTGLGIPFYRNFLNYLSSPFNIVLFLFRKENIVMAFSVVILLKVVFASVTMSFYLKKSFNKSGLLASIFGVFYAFSGYFCAYYWNIMWLDGIVFLPLIMYGINKIIDDKKPLIYIISLSVMLFANYFIAYMICIYSVFYFLGYFIYRKNFKFKNILKTFILFFISSILAAGLVSFMLVPLYTSLTSISATSGTFPLKESQFSISNFIFNHITGVNRTVFASDKLPLPNVYPGMLTLASLILLFINKKINLRFKIITLIAIIIFFFTFNISTLDYIMHAFHVPNDLPYRYSFLYVFTLVTLGYYSFSRIKELSIIEISIAFATIIILTLLASKLDFANIDDKRVIIALIFVLLYYIITVLILNLSNNSYKLYSCLVLLVIVEMIYGININWNIDHDIKIFMSDKPSYQKLIRYVKKHDNDLYRIEKTNTLTLNVRAWYDYNGVSTFTSMAYENTAKSQRKLGLAGNDINSYYYQKYQTPVYNTMFNIKYILDGYLENPYYTVITAADGHKLAKYNYTTSMMFAVDKKIKEDKLVEYNPFYNQSKFVNKAYNINGIFEDVYVKEVSEGKILDDSFKTNSNGVFTYEVSLNKELIFTLDNNEKNNIYIYISGSDVKSFYVDDNYYPLTSDEYYIADIGSKDSVIEIKINFKEENSGILRFYAYKINDEKFKEFYNRAKEESLNVKKYSDTYIEGDINVDSDKMMFTSFSYDKGFKVYVDDNEVKTYKVYDSYLAFDIKKGRHTIKVKYYPDKMREGLIISMISYVIFILLIYKTEGKNTKINRKDKFFV